MIPLATMEKLLKEAGAARVSESAKYTLQTSLSEKAHIISKKAIQFAKHAGRKTVKKEDIELVLT